MSEMDVEGREELEKKRRRNSNTPAPAAAEAPKLQSRDASAMEEEQNGTIRFQVVSNDGKPEHMIWLIGVKNIYSQQLPNMPKEYIVRLVLDRNHQSMVIIKNGKAVGGITMRPFFEQGFAEISFCAITASEQVRGYGTRLMNHTKEYVKSRGIDQCVTYADNYAIGYFKKQGFQKAPPGGDPRWEGYIKDYDGGTLMECNINPKIPYLNIPEMVSQQQEMIQKKIMSLTNSQRIFPGLSFPTDGTAMDPYAIPGVAEAGWKPREKPSLRGSLDQTLTLEERLQSMLLQVKRHSSAWPFHEAVDGDVVRDYYKIIAKPMHLTQAEKKVEDGKYNSLRELGDDLQLICDNCRKYNAPVTQYYKAADIWEAWWKAKFFPEDEKEKK